MSQERVRDFVERFFESLNCKVSNLENFIEVENVPESFEKFCGKKGPYRFCFDFEIGGCELINPGSYLMKAMNEYLDGRGETTILEMNLEFEPLGEVLKKFSLRNCKIQKIEKAIEKSHLFRFTFSTTFQYMNEKEQMINHVYVKNDEVIEMDYPEEIFLEGKKVKDIGDTEFAYNVAKNYLKEKLNDKTKEVSGNLKLVLEKEISRVEEHYARQVREYMEMIEKNSDEIRVLQMTKPTSKDELEKTELKIDRLQKEVLQIELSDEFKRTEKEKNKFIQDEIQKHSLNVKTKLLNTTVILYPKYKLQVFVKNPLGAKMIPVNYNSFEKKFSELKCDSCNSEVEEIILCGSGHLTCRQCGVKCEKCGEIYCELCMKNICNECGKKVCSNCISKCGVCGKQLCETHLRIMPHTKKLVCNNCLTSCNDCGGIVDPETLMKSKDGFFRCPDCSNKFLKKELNF